MKSQFEESYIKKRQVHTVEKADYLLELTFCNRKGLVIRALSTRMIEGDQYYCLSISDESMSEVLRTVFEGVYELFIFMKNQQTYTVDIENGVIKLKYLKFQGEQQIKQSLKLILQRKTLNFDRVTSYLIKNYAKKMETRVEEFEKRVQETILDHERKIQNIVMQKQRNRKKRKFRKLVILTILVLLVAFLFGNYRMIHKPVQPPSKSASSQIQINYQEISQIIERKMAKYGSQQKDILNKYQKDQEKTFKNNSQIVTKQYENIKNSIKILKEKIQLLQKIRQKQPSFAQNLPLFKQLIKQELQLLKQKLEQNQKADSRKTEEISHHATLNILLKQIEELQRATKRLSIFDLSSKFIQSFEIDSYSVTNLAISGRRTQICLRDQIPFEKAMTYKFNIVHSTGNSIAFGVIDALGAKEHRSSLNLKNTVAYTGRGELWKNGAKSNQSGEGFSEGSIVTMEIQLSKGTIKWLLQDKIIAQTSSQNLKNNFIQYRPYIELSTKGDIIEYIPTIHL